MTYCPLITKTLIIISADVSPELEIKDTTESNTSASYLDLLLSIGRDDFNFHMTNFPFLSSNIPSSPAYGVFISTHPIRQGLPPYECFILRALRLSNKLLGQGYVKDRLKSSLRKFYDRYGHIALHMSVGMSVGRSVCRYPLTLCIW